MVKEKKVLFDATKTINLNSGLGNYSYNLAKNLLKIKPKHFQLTFLVEKESIGVFGEEVNYEVLKPWHKFNINNFSNYDLVHASWQLSSIKSRNKNITWLYTVHDLNFLIKYQGYKQKYYTNKFLTNINRSDYLVFISNSVKNIYSAHFPLKDSENTTIYNGIEISEPNNEYVIDLPNKYLLFIGIVSEKKKIENALEFIRKLNDNIHIVIAGEINKKYYNQLIDIIKKFDLVSKVHFIGKVSEAYKSFLLENCFALINLSEQEGFGIPVAEAMNFGKPLILSNIPVFHEITNGYAFFLKKEMNLPYEFFEYIENFYLHNIDKKLIEISRMYSWEIAAKEYITIYSKLLNFK